MGEVIAFAEKAKERKEVYSFIVCPKCEGRTKIAVVIETVEGVDFISSLLCCGPKCNGEGYEVEIDNGFLGEILGLEDEN